MRIATVVAALVAALVATASAPAKTWPRATAARVCGASGCEGLTGGVARALEREFDSRQVHLPVSQAPGLAPFYRLEFLIRRGTHLVGSQSVSFVPEAGVARSAWERPSRWRSVALSSRVSDVLAKIRPFARPRVVRARVDARPVREPSSYARLYEVDGRVADAADPVAVLVETRGIHAVWRDWIFIELDSTRPSPWTDESAFLWLERRGKRLVRDGETIALPADLAARIRGRHALPLPRRDPTWLAGIALIAVAAGSVAATAGWLNPRRRRCLTPGHVPNR